MKNLCEVDRRPARHPGSGEMAVRFLRPELTFAATPDAMLSAGGTAVACDIDPDTLEPANQRHLLQYPS